MKFLNFYFMTDIFIDPNKSNIAVQVTSQSLHALGFEVTVFASDGNTVKEQFTGDTRTANPFTKILQNSPSFYKGSFIRGTFTVVSPDGTDFPYSILFSILEDNVLVNPNITVTGITTGGNDTTIAQFHIK